MEDAPAIPIAVHITRATLAKLRRECARLDISADQLAREAIEARLACQRPAKRQANADEHVHAGVRSLVGAALRDAQTWEHLQSLLRENGLDLRPRGGCLALFRTGESHPLCKASDVGPGYAALVAKFGGGFPNHSHRPFAGQPFAGPPDPLIET